MVPLTRKERDRQLRQSDILAAAEHIFAIKGYHQASIQDIARQAQYAVGTVYLYFKDKEELYTTLNEKKIQQLILSVKNKVSREGQVKEKIRALVQEHLSYFEKNEDFFRIYFAERGNRWVVKDRVSQKTAQTFMNYLEYIASLIKTAQEEKIIRNDCPPKKIAFILASMLNALVFPWLRREPGGSSNVKPAANGKGLSDMSGFILDMFFNGVKG